MVNLSPSLCGALRYVAHIFLLLSPLAHALDNPSLRYFSCLVPLQYTPTPPKPQLTFTKMFDFRLTVSKVKIMWGSQWVMWLHPTFQLSNYSYIPLYIPPPDPIPILHCPHSNFMRLEGFHSSQLHVQLEVSSRDIPRAPGPCRL